eukprot:15436-Heterococcus_DN1.PRE.3
MQFLVQSDVSLLTLYLSTTECISMCVSNCDVHTRTTAIQHSTVASAAVMALVITDITSTWRTLD